METMAVAVTVVKLESEKGQKEIKIRPAVLWEVRKKKLSGLLCSENSILKWIF